MGILKFYISIVLCIGYFAVEEILADDYETCLNINKNPRDCLEYAFENLTMSTFDNNTWGRRYYAYLYQSIVYKNIVKNPRKYCKDIFPTDEEQCIIDLSALGFNHKHGISCLHHAYTILLKIQFVEHAYALEYYKYLIQISNLKDDIKTPNQWCHEGDYLKDVRIEMRKRYSPNSSDNVTADEACDSEHNIIFSRAKYALCLNTLQTYFQFSDVIKTPQECLEHAYKNLRMLTFEGDRYGKRVYGKRYHAYLYHSILQNKTPLDNPRMYCEDYFPSEEKQCISDLGELGFNHLKGIFSFKHAYSCLLMSQLDKNAYSYKYYEYLIKTAKLTDGTKDPDQWCHDGDYSKKIKIDMRDRRQT